MKSALARTLARVLERYRVVEIATALLSRPAFWCSLLNSVHSMLPTACEIHFKQTDERLVLDATRLQTD